MTLTGGWLILGLIIAFILGIVAGTLLSRFTLRKYFEKNPPISEEMVINMMSSMGQKPNQKKVNQVMKSIKGSK